MSSTLGAGLYELPPEFVEFRDTIRQIVQERVAPRGELMRAVRAAARGESVLSPSVASVVLGQVRAPSRPDDELLSQRELEVLELVARGSTNREAAAQLFISEATVKTHLLHVYAKLGVNDRAAAVAEAYNRALLTPERR
jgi:DNA-binding NarL/FixJ family response regulator